MALLGDESELARALVERGLATAAAIERAVQALDRLRARGQAADLKALLLAWRVVAPADLEALARPAPAAPQRIGPYVLRGVLGKGASATVHDAWDPSLGRAVALKVVSLAQSDERTAKRARREARALASLVHPHVVAVHATGETRDSFWIALERVSGRSLAERTEPPGPRDAAVLLAKVARALHAAHEVSLVHRDVKPANILIDDRGEPKLADFGLALDLDGGASRLTREDAVAGSPSYLAPELLSGAEATALSDVWALGVTLHEVLTRELPFRGDTVFQLFARIQDDEPPPLRGIARDLALVAARALEKDPRDRYPDAASFAADLEAFARGEPVAARPRATGARLARAATRHKALAAGLLLAVVAAAATPLGVRWSRQRALEDAARAAGRPYEEALARGRAAEAKGDLAAALEGYTRALEARADDPVALAGRGRIESELGDFFAAARTLERAPPGPDAPPEEAAATLAALARATLDRAAIFPGLDNARLVERARDLALRARALAPGNGLAQATLARALALARRPDEARAILDRLGGPDFRDAASDVALARGSIAFAADDMRGAIREARLAALGPPRARLVAAWVLVAAGEPDEGLALLEDDPAAAVRESGTLHLLRALVLAQELRFEEAEGERLAAAALHAEDEFLTARIARATGRDSVLQGTRAIVDRAAYLLERGDAVAAERALALARQAEKSADSERQNLSDVDILLVTARALLATGDAARALECVDFGITHAGKVRSLLRVRTAVLLQLRRFPEALASADAVLEQFPGDHESVRERVRALILLDRGDEAEREAAAFTRAHKPGDPRAIELEAFVGLENGHYALALAALKRGGPGRSASLGAFAGLAERLALAPSAEPPRDLPPGADWGDGHDVVWATYDDPAGAVTKLTTERDRRRVVIGRDSTRLWVLRGPEGAASLMAPEGRAFDLGRRALAFWVHAEERESPRGLGSLGVTVTLHDAGEKKVSLRPGDLSLGGPGWHRVRVELAGDPGVSRTGDADFDASRIVEVVFQFDGLPPPGGLIWVDGVGPD